MAEKRRLPVLQNAPTPPASEGGDDGGEQPPWHWVPIGALVTIVVGAVLAKSFYVPYVQRQVDRVYGVGRTPEEYARVHQQLSTSVLDALQLRLMLAALPIAIVALFVGGFVVGRFGGGKTNARHGTLAGISSTVLLVLFAGHSANARLAIAYALLVPIGALVSWFGARVGVWLRMRAETSRP